MANAGYPVSGRISGQRRQITRNPTLEISWIFGIRINSISGTRPDIENGRISSKISTLILNLENVVTWGVYSARDHILNEEGGVGGVICEYEKK